MTTTTVQLDPIAVEVAPTKMEGYGYSVTVTSTEDNLQKVYDWAYDRFGLNAARWSIAGNETFYVADKADADAVFKHWNGRAQGSVTVMAGEG
ncbi:hypothetical protein EON82_25670 [bacterium]|nr:MAG: hypothetical protein EON82_25670 [bacterium]